VSVRVRWVGSGVPAAAPAKRSAEAWVREPTATTCWVVEARRAWTRLLCLSSAARVGGGAFKWSAQGGSG
jgi:hypothetical protein